MNDCAKRARGACHTLLRARGKLDDAEPLFREAVGALRDARGPEHPDTLAAVESLDALLQARGRDEDE